MLHTKEERKKKYKLATDTIKELYGSEKLDLHLEEIIKTYNLQFTLKEIIGDTILGFYSTTDVPKLLQEKVGISADDAQHIYTDLQEFLTPVVEQEKNQQNPKHPELKALEEVFQPTAKIPITSFQEATDSTTETHTNDISPQTQTNKAHTQVQTPTGMRTMETDINRIHGYGAYRAQFPDEAQETEHKEHVIRSVSQDELLAKTPPLADTPTYEEEESEK